MNEIIIHLVLIYNVLYMYVVRTTYMYVGLCAGLRYSSVARERET